MSLSPQNEMVEYSRDAADISRSMDVTGQLRLPSGYPTIGLVIGGSFTAEVLEVTPDFDAVSLSVMVYPRMIYRTDETPAVETPAEEASELEQVASPQEYGVVWPNEEGILVMERFEYSGVHPAMNLSADVGALPASFDKETPEIVNFSGKMAIILHLEAPQSVPIISDITAPAAEKPNIMKESFRMENRQPDKTIPITVDTVLQLSRIKPALARLISWRAAAVNISCEAAAHGLMVRGFLEVTIVYAGYDDDGQVAGVFQHDWTYGANTAIPFETRWDGDYSGEEWRIHPRIRVTQTEMAIKSHYEVHCRARLSCQVSIARVGHQEIVVDVTPAGNELIDTQKQLLELEEYIGESSGSIEMDLPLELPFGQPELERILDYQGTLHDVTVEAAPGKLLVEGSLHLGLLYLTEVGDAPKLQYIEWTSGIPVAGVIDFPDVLPEMLLRTYPTLEALQLEMNGDRSLRLTGTVGIQSSARAPRALMNVIDCATVIPVDPETRPSMLFYVVQVGDTLWKIARRYNSTVATLARMNGLLDPNAITPGQKLIIPKMVMGM